MVVEGNVRWWRRCATVRLGEGRSTVSLRIYITVEGACLRHSTDPSASKAAKKYNIGGGYTTFLITEKVWPRIIVSDEECECRRWTVCAMIRNNHVDVINGEYLKCRAPVVWAKDMKDRDQRPMLSRGSRWR